MHRRLLEFNDRLRESQFACFLEQWAAPLGLAMLLAAIWASSYTGRVQIYDNALAGCVRGQIQRAGDIDQDTDLAAFEGLARIRALRAGDNDIARGYAILEDRAQRRAQTSTALLVVCIDANKPPKILEFRSLTPHPQSAAQEKAVPEGLPEYIRDLLASQSAP
jgi:hypothetical protein